MLLRHPLPLRKNPQHNPNYRNLSQYLHLDTLLLFLLVLLCSVGLFILYSASNQNLRLIELQSLRMMFSLFILLVFAQIPPTTLKRFAPWFYLMTLALLIAVFMMGHVGKGAQRWLNFGLLHLQPAELMKLAIPLMLAWFYHRLQLPLAPKYVWISIPIVLIPSILTAKQPDLSTAVLLFIAGGSVLFLAGLSFHLITSTFFLGLFCIPFSWYFLRDYQRQRVITFLNPENDPLGKGYHIIQSKIAIGSGGIFGKGWLNGTQSNLQFLPEHSTDFIFAVVGEEFGLVGSIILIMLYMLIVTRGLYITIYAQDTFSRLVAGSITITFFVSFFINMGMVIGIVPVMGIPLPLVSYGGSSMVTIMASFGILMSIQTHRRLVTT